MIASTYNEELGILEVIYKGKISLNDLVKFGENISNNKNLPKNLRIITDATKAEYIFPVNKVPIIAKKLKEDIKDYDLVKAAFIQAKPQETAISMVMTDENLAENYHHKVFSTRESALKWLFSI